MAVIKGRTVVARFDSMTELFSKINAAGCHYGSAGAWTDGSRKVMEYIERGATQAEQQPVNAMLNKIEAGVHGRERREYVAGVAGAFPCVPDYLAGMPLNMRRRAPVESDVSPIRLIMEASMGGNVSTAQIVQRGAAMAALAIRLLETRPVELYLAWCDSVDSTHCVGMVRLDTAPISVGQLTATLCSAGFGRAATFAADYLMAGVTSGNIRWGFGKEPSDPARNNLVRELLELQPQDIFIPGGNNIEAEDYMRDPIAWVNKYLDPQRDTQ